MCLGLLGSVVSAWSDGELPMAVVDFGDHREEVCTAYRPEAAPGDDVLVHMGFVLEVLDPTAAADARSLRRGVIPDLGPAPRPDLSR